MSSATRGNAAEAAVLSALVQRGLHVFVPFGDGHPFDLAVQIAGATFLRVQCKTAWPKGGCLVFNCRSTDHGRGPQSYEGLADIFGVFFPPRQSVYLVPIDSVASFEGRLRLDPTLNNQRRRVRMAVDFEVERWTREALRKVVGGETLLAAQG
jgi:hypothetical protein